MKGTIIEKARARLFKARVQWSFDRPGRSRLWVRPGNGAPKQGKRSQKVQLVQSKITQTILLVSHSTA